MALKDNLKKRRKQQGLTLEDVARRVGITRQTVQKYESGVVSNIPLDKIELLAKALQTTPAYLMGWEDKKQDVDISTKHDTGKNNKIELTPHLQKLIQAYNSQQEMQSAIDKLLGIDE